MVKKYEATKSLPNGWRLSICILQDDGAYIPQMLLETPDGSYTKSCLHKARDDAIVTYSAWIGDTYTKLPDDVALDWFIERGFSL